MAENKEGQEKTEDPTAKRLHEARMRGQVSKSQDVTTSAILLFGGSLILIMGVNTFSQIQEFMKYIFVNAPNISISFDNIVHYYPHFLALLAGIILPVLLGIFLIVLFAEIAQVGLKIANKKFTEGLNFKQIFNPFTGIKRIFFSSRSIFELAKSIAKLLILGVVVWQIIHSRTVETLSLLEKPVLDVANFMVSVAVELLFKVAIIYILLAIADYLYQKYKFKEEMKMTKQEVKEETKQTEGDPKIKARLRQMMRQRMRKLILQKVSKADVIITNPTHYSCALQYDRINMNAPKLTAKGVDYLAFQIRAIAIKNNIPIVEEPPLARALYYNVEIDQEVPENLFRAVAQVLAYVYQLNRKIL